MRYLAIGLAAMAMLACRTHTGDDPCDPPCGPDDVTSFEECVANGVDAYATDEACPAGNRMCCALVQHCIGELDDQTVTNDMVCPEQPTVTIGYCGPECDVSHEARYEECVAGGGFGMCFEGDPDIEACCAETIGCLGHLGDYLVVSTVDCCETDDDCLGVEEYCDLANGQCRSASAICGDFFTDVGEDCDDGPTGSASLDCNYGELSCSKCTSECVHVDGEPHYCGDEALDSLDGEVCDPPGPACRSDCTPLDPTTCTNSRMDNEETDTDCGGPSCAPCVAGDDCLLDRDCTTSGGSICPLIAVCDSGDGVCIDADGCNDGDDCTLDYCQAATAGCAFDPINADSDGFICADDCDDGDPNVFPSAATRPCDGIDDDCDGDFDEGTACP
jgi:hypothetical protein